MPSRGLTEEDLQAVRECAKQWGKIIVRRGFGEQGPDLQVNFAAMEELAWVASQGLMEGTLEASLEQQAQRLGEEHVCPDCGGGCPVERDSRSLVVRGGAEVTHQEPQCYCRKCRRSFFPSAAGAGTGSPGLQSGGAGADRVGGRAAEVVCDGGAGAAEPGERDH